MTDVQVLTIALAVIVPLSMLIYSNSRITEAKETLRAEIGALRADVRADIGGLRAEMKTGFESIATSLKIHELEHHK